MTTILLSNTFPSAIYWGEKLCLLYNAAYARDRALTKHPKLMTMPYSVGWAEVWTASETLRKTMNDGMEYGVTTHAHNTPHFVNRGPIAQEEAYFSYSLAPVIAENGKVGGLFVIALDTTEQVIGERRNDLLREIGTITNQANNRRSYQEHLFREFQKNVLETPLFMAYVAEDCPSGVFPDNARGQDIYHASLAVGVQGDILSIALSPEASTSQSSSLSSTWQNLVRAAVQDRKAVIVPNDISSLICQRRAFDEVCSQIRITPFFQGTDAVSPLMIIVSGANPRRPVDQAHLSFMESLCNLMILGLAELKRGEDVAAFAENQ